MTTNLHISHAEKDLVWTEQDNTFRIGSILLIQLNKGQNMVIYDQEDIENDPKFTFEITIENAILLARQILAFYDTKQQQTQ